MEQIFNLPDYENFFLIMLNVILNISVMVETFSFYVECNSYYSLIVETFPYYYIECNSKLSPWLFVQNLLDCKVQILAALLSRDALLLKVNSCLDFEFV